MRTASVIIEYSSMYFVCKKFALKLDASIGLYEPEVFFMSNSAEVHTTLTTHKTHFSIQQASTIMAEAIAMI